MTIEELRSDLEKIISGLSSSGFDNIDSGIVVKLDELAAASDELGMKEGKRLIDNLSGAMRAIQEGKSKAESGDVRLMALDFYVKKLAGGGNIEEL
jgi:hypothetical protein